MAECLEQRVNDRLLADGYITEEQHARLIIRDGKVWDNSTCNWSISDDGNVVVTEAGAYPYVLDGYAYE